MKRTLIALALCAGAAALTTASLPAVAQTPPEVTLTRLDCGTQVENDISVRFTDTCAYPGQKRPFTFSCYLIKHGGDYMLWDTGHSMSAGAPAPKVSMLTSLRSSTSSLNRSNSSASATFTPTIPGSCRHSPAHK